MLPPHTKQPNEAVSSIVRSYDHLSRKVAMLTRCGIVTAAALPNSGAENLAGQGLGLQPAELSR